MKYKTFLHCVIWLVIVSCIFFITVILHPGLWY